MVHILLFILSFQTVETTGYRFEGDNIVFKYKGVNNHSVFVSGNFNSWTKSEEKWKLSFDAQAGIWTLTIPKKEVKSHPGNFYEFTFRVDGKLVDAEKDNNNTIHCPGYGYRYIIKNI